MPGSSINPLEIYDWFKNMAVRNQARSTEMAKQKDLANQYQSQIDEYNANQQRASVLRSMGKDQEAAWLTTPRAETAADLMNHPVINPDSKQPIVRTALQIPQQQALDANASGVSTRGLTEEHTRGQKISNDTAQQGFFNLIGLDKYARMKYDAPSAAAARFDTEQNTAAAGIKDIKAQTAGREQDTLQRGTLFQEGSKPFPKELLPGVPEGSNVREGGGFAHIIQQHHQEEQARLSELGRLGEAYSMAMSRRPDGTLINPGAAKYYQNLIETLHPELAKKLNTSNPNDPAVKAQEADKFRQQRGQSAPTPASQSQTVPQREAMRQFMQKAQQYNKEPKNQRSGVTAADVLSEELASYFQVKPEQIGSSVFSKKPTTVVKRDSKQFTEKFDKLPPDEQDIILQRVMQRISGGQKP